MSIGKRLGRVAVVMVAVIVLALTVAVVVYPPVYVYRVLVWQGSDAFDWQKFPARPLQAAKTPHRFDARPDQTVGSLFERLSGADDWGRFLEETGTQAFLVIRDGELVFEEYFNETQRDSMVTSFSVAKSFTSALIGIAIEEGHIDSVDNPITTYLPELAARDPRFQDITIRHVLLMASGLEYQDLRAFLLNGDDPLTTYYPDQRELGLENTHIIAPPGRYFSYNKYHPQWLGMILERATGMSVTAYLQTRIWDRIGMEYDGSWSLDSQASGFEKMETGVNARAIDFAKFGLLFLNGGRWEGQPVVPQAWVDASTQPYLPTRYDEYYDDWVKAMPGQGYYAFMWWGMVREDGGYDFFGEGDKGQFIYVSPRNNLIIVRNGLRFGVPSDEWLQLFFAFASQY